MFLKSHLPCHDRPRPLPDTLGSFHFSDKRVTSCCPEFPAPHPSYTLATALPWSALCFKPPRDPWCSHFFRTLPGGIFPVSPTLAVASLAYLHASIMMFLQVTSNVTIYSSILYIAHPWCPAPHPSYLPGKCRSLWLGLPAGSSLPSCTVKVPAWAEPLQRLSIALDAQGCL